MSGRKDRTQPAPGDLALARADPAPHTWMDLPTSGAPPIPTVVVGALFVGLAGVAVGVPVARGDLGRHPGLLVLSFLHLVLGLTLVRIGVQRFRWRRRHPGVDPLLTEGSRPPEPDRLRRRLLRALVLLLGIPVALFLGLVVIGLAAAEREPGQSAGVRVGSLVLAVVVTALTVAMLVADARAIRRAGRRRRDRASRSR